MRKILFIGHYYHKSTGSSAFFQDLLRSEYELTLFSLDPEGDSEWNVLAELCLDDYDCVLLWQIDYLASYFLRRGVRTIVCPMYDASGILDRAHWQAMAGALIICFSLELHYKVQSAGVSSLYIRYFPEKPAFLAQSRSNDDHMAGITSSLDENKDSKGLRVFFWERLPDTALNLSSVIKILSGLPVSHLHVHQAADPGRKPSLMPAHDQYLISSSTWFESKDDYLRAIQDSDIYIAPRFSEGIGMGFLEAMNLGCCVVANDMTTHNEYISNWKNGILVDFVSPGEAVISATAESVRSMGHQAQTDAEAWRNSWISFYSEIALKAIESYVCCSTISPAVPSGLPATVSFLKALDELTNLRSAHQNWKAYWSHLASILVSNGNGKHSETLVMPRINRLVMQGKITEAYEELCEVIRMYPGERTIYSLFADHLQDRVSRNCADGIDSFQLQNTK